MHEYEPLFHYREEVIDDIQPWLWQQCDNEAWTGPKQNWENGHKRNILSYVKKFDCVVQAGGNHGMYPRLLSPMFKTVYTFEPDSLSYFALVNNCQQDNIIKMQAALGDAHKMVAVYRAHMSNTGMHRIIDQDAATIPMLMLDDFVFPNLDFLWLDVEGYEENILKGATRNLEQHHPVIFCENGHQGIDQLLLPLGYRNHGRSEMDTIYAIS